MASLMLVPRERKDILRLTTAFILVAVLIGLLESAATLAGAECPRPESGSAAGAFWAGWIVTPPAAPKTNRGWLAGRVAAKIHPRLGESACEILSVGENSPNS
jgi:hypothetical protein